MKFNAHYCSFLPVLIKVISITTGDVLELGTGIYSTPVLHWLCSPKKRRLVSYESDPRYLSVFNLWELADEFHQIVAVDDWDKAEIEEPWDVAFVDHAPAERRKVEVARLASYAQYVIIHDSDWRNRKHYHYEEIYPLFKYHWDYTVVKTPWTTVLSNFVDLKDFSC